MTNHGTANIASLLTVDFTQNKATNDRLLSQLSPCVFIAGVHPSSSTFILQGSMTCRQFHNGKLQKVWAGDLALVVRLLSLFFQG